MKNRLQSFVAWWRRAARPSPSLNPQPASAPAAPVPPSAFSLQPSCKTCLWWSEWPVQPRNGTGPWGDCHARSPHLMILNGDDPRTKWPSVRDTCTCGDWTLNTR